jgi:SAM-dependent methyltransferase
MNLKKYLKSILDTVIYIRLFIKGKILPGFFSKQDELVIDLGCGDKPLWRADVSLDKTALGNEQRYSSTGITKGFGRFVDGDISRTPFKNKAFDFSFCSHVLEHVARPDLAIDEIVRISKRGYIEVPSGMHEMSCPYQSHLWFVFLSKKEIIFVRKSKGIHEVLSHQAGKHLSLDKFIKSPFIHIYWTGKIKYRIINDIKKDEVFVSTRDDRSTQLKYIQMGHLIIARILRKFFYKNKGSKIDALFEKNLL